MYFVYILMSINYPDKIYKGYTRDIRKRLTYHNEGKVSSTMAFSPWRVESYFSFSDKRIALDFEKYLKTASGIAFMRKRLISV